MSIIPVPSHPLIQQPRVDGIIDPEWWSFLSDISGASSPANTSFNNTQVAAATSYTVQTTDIAKSIEMTANALDSVIFGAPAGYASNHFNLVVNRSTSRGKLIVIDGVTQPVLWPEQQRWVLKGADGLWYTSSPYRWRSNSATFNVTADGGSGSDTNNDGLGTGTGAFATIAQANSTVTNWIDSLGGPPSIQLGDGTHSVGAGINVNYPIVGRSQLYFKGHPGSSGSVIVSCLGGGGCFLLRDQAIATVTDMTLSTVGNGSVLFNVSQGSVGDLSGVDFNAAPAGTHISVNTFSSVNVLGAYTINGGANTHFTVSRNGYINYGVQVTIGAAMTFGIFAQGVDCGVCSGGPAPFVNPGNVTAGQKYNVSNNAVFSTGGQVFPGPTAGATATGGQFA
jgi:hypothetical protein